MIDSKPSYSKRKINSDTPQNQGQYSSPSQRTSLIIGFNLVGIDNNKIGDGGHGNKRLKSIRPLIRRQSTNTSSDKHGKHTLGRRESMENSGFQADDEWENDRTVTRRNYTKSKGISLQGSADSVFVIYRESEDSTSGYNCNRGRAENQENLG